MKEKNKTIFRRVRGRIIPIRVSDDTKEKAKGAASIVAGLGVAVASAELAARAVKRSADLRIKARKEFKIASALQKAAKRSLKVGEQTSFNFGTKVAKDWKRTQAKSRLVSGRLFSMRNLLLGAGTYAAGSLIIRGADKFREKNKRATIPQGFATDTLGGSLIAGGIGSLYYARLGVKNPIANALFAYSRVKKVSRPFKIPIRGVQGVLKF